MAIVAIGALAAATPKIRASELSAFTPAQNSQQPNNPGPN